MKATTPKFKQIMASGNARDYVVKVDLTLADDPNTPTVLHLTEEDIWNDSFSIETASSGTSSFDIGTAVIGQCKFSLNNFDERFNQYDFFNASAVVWVGLKGDTDNNDQQVYYRMGFFTVDEPTYAGALIQLVLLDNMWKFDVPMITLNYPISCLNAVLAICSHCDVQLDQTVQFHGASFTISEAPEGIDNMNCRDFIQYVAMIGCNFCIITPEGKLKLRWYDTSAIPTAAQISSGIFDNDVNDFSINFDLKKGTDAIQITGVKFILNDTAHTIGTTGYMLELDNPLVNDNNVNSVLNLIWDVLENFTLRIFSLTTASDLAVEVGDCCVAKDYRGRYVYSWVTLNTFKFAAHQVQCNAVAPTRTLTKQFSKVVQAAVAEARIAAGQVVSNYDLAVQMMNSLAVNAMGGYEDYEDLGTSGRVWYLSNMPITKTGGVCSFETGSTVYKKSGSGFFVSRDGGQTWVNGYDMSTGELVVNVLDAIGINFDWARGGTLTLGGYGNGNGVLSIQDANNVEKVHGDNTGIKVGATTGSKIFMNTDGEIQYLYDNAYSGKMRMEAYNRGTEIDPDIVDSLAIRDFDSIRLNGEEAGIEIESYSNNTGEINISAQSTSSNCGHIDLNAKKIYLADGSFLLDSDSSFSAVHVQTDVFDFGYPNEIQIGGNSASANDNNYILVLDSTGKAHACFLNRGIITNWTAQGTNLLDFWHTWSSGGQTYSAIILGVGVTQAQFPSIDPTLHYDPYIECADGVSPPKITDMVTSGTTLTVTFTAVTSQQAGSGETSACVIKLRTIV